MWGRLSPTDILCLEPQHTHVQIHDKGAVTHGVLIQLKVLEADNLQLCPCPIFPGTYRLQICRCVNIIPSSHRVFVSENGMETIPMKPQYMEANMRQNQGQYHQTWL